MSVSSCNESRSRLPVRYATGFFFFIAFVICRPTVYISFSKSRRDSGETIWTERCETFLKKVKKTVYVALSLTHVRTEAEKEEIREFFRWLEKWLKERFDVELLQWAFDLEKWKSKPVANIFQYDTMQVTAAGLLVALYLSSEGSDGRGGEVAVRISHHLPTIAFKRKGVTVSNYARDCLGSIRVNISEIEKLTDIESALRATLIANKIPELEPVAA